MLRLFSDGTSHTIRRILLMWGGLLYIRGDLLYILGGRLYIWGGLLNIWECLLNIWGGFLYLPVYSKRICYDFFGINAVKQDHLRMWSNNHLTGGSGGNSVSSDSNLGSLRSLSSLLGGATFISDGIFYFILLLHLKRRWKWICIWGYSTSGCQGAVRRFR